MRRTALLPTALTIVALVAIGAGPLLAPHRLLQSQRTLEDIARATSEGGHQGDCDQCHTQHGNGPVVYGHALVGPDENSLCEGCHNAPWADSTYAGAPVYEGSAHAAGSGTVWPGPDPAPRTEPGAAGKCLNCHDAHGLVDDAGRIPALTVQRGDRLCLACHDGSPATTDIAADTRRGYRHDPGAPDRHTGPGESTPAEFGSTPLNRRHAVCVDCHNPHVGTRDPAGPPPAPELSRALLGVSRLLVQNFGPGTAPQFTFLPASDSLTTPRAEYQVCFKCHSTWTTPPNGQADLPVELNPANASYHPVEAAGRNPVILPGAFVGAWSGMSVTSCGDCHGSNADGAPRGPHGSDYRYILKAPYAVSTQARTMDANELCFSCHTYDVYANPQAPEAVRAASRFNAPATASGHAEHVGALQVPCATCHVTHGAPNQPHLIVTGRLNGLTSYTETPAGGTCQAACHPQGQSYTINYAR